MKGTSRQYTFLKDDLGSLSLKNADKSFRVLQNIPIFINVNIAMNLAENCDGRALVSSKLRHKKGIMYCIDVRIGYDVMMPNNLDETSSENTNIERSHDKFLNIIRKKQLLEHHNMDNVVTISLDTNKGYYDYISSEYDTVLTDIENLVYFMARKTCVSDTNNNVFCEVGGQKETTRIVLNFNIDSSALYPISTLPMNVNLMFYPR